MRVQIPVLPGMIQMARVLGQERAVSGSRRPTTRPMTHAPLRLEMAGVLAEIAMCWASDWADAAIWSHDADPGWDYITESGNRVDVKATLRRPEQGVHLVLPVSKPITCERYVLCAVDLAEWTCLCCGWARAEDILAAPQRQLRPDGPLNRVLAEDQLRQWA